MDPNDVILINHGKENENLKYSRVRIIETYEDKQMYKIELKDKSSAIQLIVKKSDVMTEIDFIAKIRSIQLQGDIFQKQFKFTQAIKMYKKAFELAKKINISQKFVIELGIAYCYGQCGNYEKSEEIYLRFFSMQNICLDNTDLERKNFIEGLMLTSMIHYVNSRLSHEVNVEENIRLLKLVSEPRWMKIIQNASDIVFFIEFHLTKASCLATVSKTKERLDIINMLLEIVKTNPNVHANTRANIYSRYISTVDAYGREINNNSSFDKITFKKMLQKCSAMMKHIYKIQGRTLNTINVEVKLLNLESNVDVNKFIENKKCAKELMEEALKFALLHHGADSIEVKIAYLHLTTVTPDNKIAQKYLEKATRINHSTGEISNRLLIAANQIIGNRINRNENYVEVENSTMKETGGMRRCSNILCKNIETKLGEFKRCARCLAACYCSQKCQRRDWTKGGHKQNCKPSEN